MSFSAVGGEGGGVVVVVFKDGVAGIEGVEIGATELVIVEVLVQDLSNRYYAST